VRLFVHMLKSLLSLLASEVQTESLMVYYPTVNLTVGINVEALKILNSKAEKYNGLYN